MPKAMIFLALLVIAGVIALFYFGGRRLLSDATTGQPKKESIQKKETAKAAQPGDKLFDKAAQSAKNLASDAVKLVERPGIKLEVTLLPIVVEAGAPATVKITRSGGELKPLKLQFFPAPGSQLTVTGGEFAQGAAETTFTVEAVAAGRDASLTIQAGDEGKVTVPVQVK
jgi:hypothetical protein